MDFEQTVALLTALGDLGNLFTGMGDFMTGSVEFGGSVQGLLG
ncbi:hypothetical protein [Rhodococcus daqingensis]|uniref:Uncharacterized protein n=1 Tax=Rhodococcus daqingensis TaxID=2479363 RepID=A0ABW2RRL3_9NOCA